MQAAFLKKCGIAFSRVQELPQDASTKKYFRVFLDKSRSVSEFQNLPSDTILLLYYPDSANIFNKFITIAKVLSVNGIITPQIYEYDTENNFILLEDFGDISVKKFLQNQHSDFKSQIYLEIINSLYKIQKVAPDSLGRFYDTLSKERFLKQLSFAFPWYLRYLNKQDGVLDEYTGIWRDVLDSLPNIPNVMVHRDFHVENLFIVPAYNNQNDGKYSIGIIDFQDSVFSHPVYDLVSLLSDARIEVDNAIKTNAINHYIKLSNLDKESVLTSLDILGAQNCIRILGIFAKKAIDENNKNYLKFIPRVENYLRTHLELPALHQVKALMYSYIGS